MVSGHMLCIAVWNIMQNLQIGAFFIIEALLDLALVRLQPILQYIALHMDKILLY